MALGQVITSPIRCSPRIAGGSRSRLTRTLPSLTAQPVGPVSSHGSVVWCETQLERDATALTATVQVQRADGLFIVRSFDSTASGWRCGRSERRNCLTTLQVRPGREADGEPSLSVVVGLGLPVRGLFLTGVTLGAGLGWMPAVWRLSGLGRSLDSGQERTT
jgi:hypothetical protein